MTWVKVEGKDGNRAWLVTYSTGGANAFADLDRALGAAEGFLGLPLTRSESAFGEITYYASRND